MATAWPRLLRRWELFENTTVTTKTVGRISRRRAGVGYIANFNACCMPPLYTICAERRPSAEPHTRTHTQTQTHRKRTHTHTRSQPQPLTHKHARKHRQFATANYSLRGSNPPPMARKTIALTSELREQAACSTTPFPQPTQRTHAEPPQNQSTEQQLATTNCAVQDTPPRLL